MKKSPILLLCVCFTLAVAGCSSRTYREMSEEEIKKLLSDVVASQQSIEEAGLRYFSALSAENNNLIQVPDLKQKLERRENIFVLDIRREADYLAGHVQTAQNIWWFDIGRRIDLLPKDRPIVVYCYTGQSAGQVVGVLQVMGYDAKALAGGFKNGWQAANMPTVADR